MRIWHQSFTVLQDLPAYADALRARIDQVVRPGSEVVLHGQIPGTYSSDYPGTDLAYGVLYWVHGLQWIAAAREAEKQGFDAMVLASIGSPMAREIRTVVDIPVVGYGEAAFNLAGLYGRRAGMLFFIKDRLDFWPEQLRAWGLEERFAGIEQAGVSFRDVLDAYLDPARLDGVVGRIVEQGEKLVRETGADVIVPGEMPMNLLLSKAGVHEIAGAAVIDGIAVSFKMAELLVDLRKVGGMRPSRHGYFHASPDRGRVAQVLDFYGVGALGDRIPSMP
ncbi:aspartate/glutamate racemase family protein [Pigmentiphaga soli]|uniref:Aspartate/glutamate racemase family protein n=1 Tax=Pigmentiphaga soli TaxID=1007095 RepID=A0ABP8GF24_9BURK